MPAFGLAENLEKLLHSDSRMTNETINPSNLESMKPEEGWRLPPNFLGFTEETANQEIDKVTDMAEKYAQGTRVVQAYQHLADVTQKFDLEKAKLASKVTKMEITKEEAFAQWNTLQQQLNVARRKAGLKHANDVEASNIGFESFRRKLQDNLNRATDTSRGGIQPIRGRRRGNRRRVALAV